MKKHQLLQLRDEIVLILNSGTLSPENETKLLNLKKIMEEALITTEQEENADFTVILAVIKLLIDFFGGLGN